MESVRPKVSMVPTGQTPAEQATAKALQTHDVIDERGRTLTLKKPPILAMLRLVEMVGGEASSNQTYMGIVSLALYVVAIDGEQVYLPTKKSELEALIQQIEEQGLTAVSGGVSEHWPQSSSPGQDRALLKK